MMDKLKKNMVFYLLLLIDFYIVPLVYKKHRKCNDCYVSNYSSNMFNNLCFYGIRNGFNFWYILIVAIMFAPSIYIL